MAGVCRRKGGYKYFSVLILNDEVENRQVEPCDQEVERGVGGNDGVGKISGEVTCESEREKWDELSCTELHTAKCIKLYITVYKAVCTSDSHL